MPSPARLLALPASLLLLVSHWPARAAAPEQQWPYNLPPHVKYYPEDDLRVKRHVEAQERLQSQPVTGVRKMSDDPGEMFFLEYWSFDAPADDCANSSAVTITATTLEDDASAVPIRNDSGELGRDFDFFAASFNAPLLPHLDRDPSSSPSLFSRHLRFPILGRSLLDKRGFQCPSGSSACTSINEPNICCAIGDTCQFIPDTGLGNVGCCPAGETCGGSLSACPSGFTSCPHNPGGGCCVPGYGCFGIGCALTSTATVVVAPSTITTVSAVATVSETTTRTEIHTCPSGLRSCPASLGGGCCASDRVCASNSCPETSTASVGPAVRPNSVSAASVTTTNTVVGCPTGYYACSAFYPGGCCQIGRDCHSTSCPATARTTLVDTNSLTIVAPTGTGVFRSSLVLTGTCAYGWSSCASSDGGGCCPDGYVCGVSCTATATGGNSNIVGKIPPNGAARPGSGIGLHLTIFWGFTALILAY